MGINVSMSDQVFMQQAYELAVNAQTHNEVPVGAVVVYEGVVIGQGWNQPITQHDPTAHAEIIALRQAALYLGNYRLPSCDLYVTLEPCPMCAGAMVHARIRRLIYAADDPRTGAAGSVYDIAHSSKLNHRIQIDSGILQSESRALLQAFFAARR